MSFGSIFTTFFVTCLPAVVVFFFLYSNAIMLSVVSLWQLVSCVHKIIIIGRQFYYYERERFMYEFRVGLSQGQLWHSSVDDNKSALSPSVDDTWSSLVWNAKCFVINYFELRSTTHVVLCLKTIFFVNCKKSRKNYDFLFILWLIDLILSMGGRKYREKRRFP